MCWWHPQAREGRRAQSLPQAAAPRPPTQLPPSAAPAARSKGPTRAVTIYKQRRRGEAEEPVFELPIGEESLAMLGAYLQVGATTLRGVWHSSHTRHWFFWGHLPNGTAGGHGGACV